MDTWKACCLAITSATRGLRPDDCYMREQDVGWSEGKSRPPPQARRSTATPPPTETLSTSSSLPLCCPHARSLRESWRLPPSGRSTVHVAVGAAFAVASGAVGCCGCTCCCRRRCSGAPTAGASEVSRAGKNEKKSLQQTVATR